MAKQKILALNNISSKASVLLGNYDFSSDEKDPDAIVVRSADMHSYAAGEKLLAVARAGAGVNNIPVDEYSKRGIVVFNTPGANANAVKELVLASLLMCGRKITNGIDWAKTLKGKGDEVGKLVESGKKAFVGGELYGKTLGVIGLGAIGALVANAGISLGMTVIGYDPSMSVESAWRIDRHVKKETSVAALAAECDFITLHVPYMDSTKNMINADILDKAKDGISIINLSRGGLVSNKDILAAVASGKVNRYVTDFPADELIGVENIICIPHLGASTPEAEDNCAVMAATQLDDFLANGNVVNSVNFPTCAAAFEGVKRITVIHKNEKNILSGLTEKMGSNGINIENLISKSKGDYAYTILDLASDPGDKVVAGIKTIPGVIRVRVI